VCPMQGVLHRRGPFIESSDWRGECLEDEKKTGRCDGSTERTSSD
jgi:hypothetical protein